MKWKKILSIMLKKDELNTIITKLIGNKTNYAEGLRAIISGYENVVFYGCGLMFRGLVSTWQKEVGVKINYCCDSDSQKKGSFFSGIECISLEQLKEIADKTIVFITCSAVSEIKKVLNYHGINSVYEIYKLCLMMHDVEVQLLGNSLTELYTAYSSLADEKSRKIFLDYLSIRLAPFENEGLMAKNYEPNQYFTEELIALSQHESFVDAGAYDGDTMLDFFHLVNGKYDDYYAFELDDKVFKTLEKTVNHTSEAEKVKLFNKGLWDKNEDIFYSTGETVSSIGSGEKIGKVVRLDDVLEAKKVTFIKMDIEGSELNALKGAEKIIKQQQPVLTISLYHKINDLWQLINYVNSIADYNIFIRHHTVYEYETVMYAIPKK